MSISTNTDRSINTNPRTADSAAAQLTPLPRDGFENTPASRERALEQIRAAGVRGLGGGQFNTAQKLRAATGARALIINGLQSEPDNHSDLALLQQETAGVIAGAALAAFCISTNNSSTTTKADQSLPDIILAVPEQNEPTAKLSDSINSAIKSETTWLTGLLGEAPSFRCAHLPVNHASGEEHRLAISLGLLAEPPTTDATPDRTPLVENGILCINLATAYALERAIVAGEPLRRRMVSVNGKAQWLDFGTPLESLFAGGQTLESIWVNGRHGGMVANAHPNNAYVHAGLFCVTDAPAEPHATCINCSACVPVCPVGLHPDELFQQLDRKQEPAAHLNLNHCLECGACNAVCPSKLPLAQVFRRARTTQIENAEKTRLALKAKARSDARTTRIAARETDRAARVEARTQRSKRAW